MQAMRLRMLKRVLFTPEVCAGRGSIQRLACLDSGVRVLVVTGASAARTGALQQVTAQLKDAASEIVTLPSGEPTAATVSALSAQVSAFAPEWIAAVGGGSVLDSAKFLWAQYEHPELTWRGPAAAIPPLRAKAHLILAPTTSGSGSESSQAAVLVDDAGAKVPYVSAHWVPDLAILDPSLTVSMPRALTASTGLDALTHAVESAVSSLSHAMLRTLCGTAIRAILRHLPEALRNGENLAAREAMQNASYLGGLCQSTASTGAAHALSHATSTRLGVAHGLGTGFYLLPTMRANLAKNAAVYDELAAECGFAGGAALADAIEGLGREAGLPATISALAGRDLSDEDVKAVADGAMKDVCLRTNACRLAAAEVQELVEKLR